MRLNEVVYSNGDVSVRENHEHLGNPREKSFGEIWNPPEAQALRQSIAAKACYRTNEVFLWPGITLQPRQLGRVINGAKAWRGVEALPAGESPQAARDAGETGSDHERLATIQTSSGKI
jgi:hypothetical protein